MACTISCLVYSAELGPSCGPRDGCDPFFRQANRDGLFADHRSSSNVAAYHQLLNRARWNPLLSARLLSVIVEWLVPGGPVVIGMEDK